MTIAATFRLVNPQNPSILHTTPSPWKLGPLDLVNWYFPAVSAVFLYEPSPSPISLGRLETALAYLLNYYPQLSGRLHIDWASGKHTIDHLGTGAELHEATLDQPLSAFRNAGVYSIIDQPGGDDLLAPHDPSIPALIHAPVLTVKHTRFACGGVALGIRCPHVVTDGEGFFRMIGDLASIYRGLDGPEKGKLAAGREPWVMPYGVELDEAEADEIAEYMPALFSLAPPFQAAIPSPDAPLPPRVIGRALHFSSSDLSLIQRLASDASFPKRISTFVALSAWLYQQVHKGRRLLPSHPITTADFFTPLNLRAANRLPTLPQNYFPNAALAHFTSISPDDISTSSLPHIAGSILGLISESATVGSEAESTIKWLASQPNFNEVHFGMKFGPGAFMITQWNKFDLYGAGAVQFVEGEKPVLVSLPPSALSLVDGLTYTLPPPPNEGKEGDGIVVYIGLIEPLWEVLEREGLLRVKAE